MRNWSRVKTSLVGWLRLLKRFLVVGDLQGLANFEGKCSLSYQSAAEVGWDDLGLGETTGAWQLWLDTKGEWTERGSEAVLKGEEVFLMVESGVSLLETKRNPLSGECGVWLDDLLIFGSIVSENGLRRSRLKLEGCVWEGVCRGIWEEEEFEFFRRGREGVAEFERWMGVLTARELALGVDGGMVGIEEGADRVLKPMMWYPYLEEGLFQCRQEGVEAVVREWLRMKLRSWHLWGLVQGWVSANGFELKGAVESALWNGEVLVEIPWTLDTVWVGVGSVSSVDLKVGALVTVIPREEKGIWTQGRTWMSGSSCFEWGLRDEGVLQLGGELSLKVFANRFLKMLDGVEEALRGEVLSC